jgi:outer membrane protein assembly factor BamB
VSCLRALAVGTALFALMCAACSARSPVRNQTVACLGPVPTLTPSMQQGTRASWTERIAERESQAELVSDEAVDPAIGVAYALISRARTPLRGPYVLECTVLHTGVVRKGPVLPVGHLAVASGYLWVYGAAGGGSHPRVSQVDLRNLELIRPVHLPAVPAPTYPAVTVAAGPDDSVWIGSFQALLRVDAATGAVLVRVRLPAGLAVSDISVDPGRGHLYVSVAHLVNGGIEGNEVFEYDARSGRRLAVAANGLVTDSVAGAALTAVPGGVWASFRTGMLGLTIHLRQHDLAVIAPPGPGIALTPATSVFHWPMYATTVYGGGALWLANQTGIVACLDPQTGKVRAQERLAQARLIYRLLAADPVSRQVFAAGARGLVRISPPRRCWAAPSTKAPGTVAGTLVRIGGPAPGSPVPLPGRVVAIGSAGARFTTAVGTNGRFRLSLLPGTYRLTGYSPLVRANGAQMSCAALHPVHVTADKTRRDVDVVCSIP